MGLNYHYANFLLFAKKKMGVDLNNALSLGRQHLFLTKPEMASLLATYGFMANDAQIADLASAKFADDFLRFVGCTNLQSMDFSDYEGAQVIHNLNTPIDPSLNNKYSCVIDGGTIEHVFNFPTCIDNCMKLTAVGGHFLSINVANNFMGHGFYQFSPELFFNTFCEANGFKVVKLFIVMDGEKHWYEVPDPAVTKQRVQVVNSKRTTILVLGQRISENAGILQTPQQGYYELNWEDGENREVAAKSAGLGKYKHKIAEVLSSTIGVDAVQPLFSYYRKRNLQRIVDRNYRRFNPAAS